MENMLQRIWAYYERITTSIAFYPSIYAIFSVLTGFFMTYVERAGISIYLQEHVSILRANVHRRRFARWLVCTLRNTFPSRGVYGSWCVLTILLV